MEFFSTISAAISLTPKFKTEIIKSAQLAKDEADHFFGKGLLKYLDKQIQIGIRPEDIIVSENLDAKCDCKAKVMAYENMGNEQLVYLSLGNHTLIARRPPADTVEIGNEISVSFSKDKIIFMQEESGEVI